MHLHARREREICLSWIVYIALFLQADADFAVDYKALQLLDYPKVIKKPMDLGTIQEKLLNGSYSTLREVCIMCCCDYTLVVVLLHACHCRSSSLLWMWSVYGQMRFCTTKIPRIWCMSLARFRGMVLLSVHFIVLRHQAALRGRDELWRSHHYPGMLDTLQKLVSLLCLITDPFTFVFLHLFRVSLCKIIRQICL